MMFIFSTFAQTDNIHASMDIEQIISRTYPLPPSSMERMKAYMQEVELPKGHHVLRMGKVEKDIFFIKRGIARAYTTVDGNDVTFWIGEEGDTLVSMNGYVNNQPGYESMELMEPSVLYVLKHRDLQRLFLDDIHIANWGRRYAETELIATERRLISFLLTDASERYSRLMADNPEYLQRLPLGSIASYLGITQVSLSRIRAKIK